MIRYSTTVAVLILISLKAGAAIIQVDDDGAECATAPHTTIPAAITAAAMTGDTIEICPGTYGLGGTTVVDKELIIDGTDRDTVIIEVGTSGTYGFHVRIGNVTISDLTLRKTNGATGTNGIRYEENGAMDPLNNLLVDNVIFDGFDDSGARGIEMHLGTFNDFTVRDSRFLDNRNGIRFGSDTVLDGMVLTGSDFVATTNTANFCCNGLYQANDGNTSTFRDLQASGNTFTNMGLSGMFIEEIRDSTIQMNTFAGNYTGIIINKLYSVASTELQNVVISNNMFTDNYGRAVFFNSPGLALGTGNQFLDNTITVNLSQAVFTTGALTVQLPSALAHEQLVLSGNNVTYSGAFGANNGFGPVQSAYGIHLRGDGPVDITLGNLDGSMITPGTGTFAGIYVESNHDDPDVGDVDYGLREDTLNVTCNTMTGFEDGLHVFDQANGVVGGLPGGVVVNVMTNDIVGNSAFGINNAGTSENIDAVSNYWGDPSGPGGTGPGSGDPISVNVDGSGPLFGVQTNCTTPVELLQFDVG